MWWTRYLCWAAGSCALKANLLKSPSLPIDTLESLARLADVEFVRRPYTGIAAEVVSEGVTRVGADSWQLGGFLGDGVKVAIVDLGLEGYASLLGTELPGSVVTRSFRIDGDIEVGNTHGVRVAEVVHDMAPNASLYLVNFDDELDLSAAVDWLIAEGVGIVNHSISWFNVGPGDGSGFINEIVERARSNGILWVNSAGNRAQTHWEAPFSDTDGDGWHNYAANDLGNTFFGGAGQVVRIWLSWNDWPASNQDYDLYLARSSDGTLIRRSENFQTGTQPPVERIVVALPADDFYYIAILRFNATQDVNLELFVNFDGLQYVVPSGSLTIPADSPDAVAVGATHWTNDLVEPYSSLGPTTDGRIKPDISAPTCTTGSLGQFCGTSASAPHVSGAAALVKQANPSFTPGQIQAFLESESLDLGSPGLDSSYGWGRLRLPTSSVVTVPSTADPGDGLCDLAECTLREAIDAANASPVTDNINFNINTTDPGYVTSTDSFRIQPGSALPTITEPVVIDGYTQPGASPNTNGPGLGLNTVLKIELDGSNAGANANGLRITGGGSTVRGLVINRFTEAGASVETNGDNVIEGNFIGTDITGTLDLGNTQNGVIIHGSNNTIGGTTPGARNVISGNNYDGVVITGVSFSATGNVVQGNFIGTDVTGTTALGNGSIGVEIDNASNNTIGGTVPGARNVISGNVTGVLIAGSGTTGNLILGNFIGTDVSGTLALGNAFDGVRIHLDASNNAVGGTDPGAGNTIAFNGTAGVSVQLSTDNAILSNSTFSNGGLAIDLTLGWPGDGPTPNDADDGDTGANNLQNFPEIASAEIGATGDLVIEYLVDSAIITSTYPLLVEFFIADADGEEGQAFIASHMYVTSTAQTSTVANLGGATGLGVAEGDFIVGTATDAGGNTSEFSFPAVEVKRGAFVVDSTGDGGDSSSGDGFCSDGTGFCTLRAAIEEANALIGLDTIAFNITTTDPGYMTSTDSFRIQPGSNLRKITDPVIIDGYTQPGASPNTNPTGQGLNAVLKIELDGSNLGSTGSGMILLPGDSTIRGLIINHFDNGGILIDVDGGNVMEGNFIGTDVTGMNAAANGGAGVGMTTGNNLIGGSTAGARNLISGNREGVIILASSAVGNSVQGNLIGTDVTGAVALANSGAGVRVSQAPDNIIGGVVAGAGNVISGNTGAGLVLDSLATRSLVQGNFIGTDVTGTVDLGNSGSGVLIDGASNNAIGGTTSGTRNVISANGGDGVVIGGPSTGNFVQGNFIGTDVTGSLNRGNSVNGVRIASARGNTIGGTTAGARNVISGNNQSGVRIDGNGATGNLVQGNFIGTDVTGMISLGNTRVGVVVTGGASNTSIGGTAAGSGNLISSNGTNGVAITVDAFGNSVEGNLIGVDATGIGALGNGLRGVAISASSNTVGGTDLGAANTIAFSGGDGVWVESGTGNAILSNAIFSNVGLGIDLGNDGPTANEADDADIGPNNLQNFPEIASAEIGATGDLVIEYLVDSAIVTSTYPLLVEFFVADADGEEGQTFIASHVYVTSTAQTSTVANLGGATALGVAGGDNIVATATDADGNTSEFSLPATIVTQVLPCTLDVNLGFADGVITWTFLVGAEVPSTWSTSVILLGNDIPLWSIDLPTLPPITIGFSFPIPPIGVIEVRSVLAVEGGECTASDSVDTGG